MADGHFFQNALSIHMMQQITIWTISITWALIRPLNNTQKSNVLLHLCRSDSWGGVINPHFLMHGVDHWLLITDILQEACPEDKITEAIVMSLGDAILFFGRCSHNEGLLYWKVKDIELGLRCLFNWAGKPAQIEVTVNTMQEVHQGIVDAVVEKRTKARGQDTPKEWWKQPRPLLQHSTLKSGCRAWKKKPLKGEWDMVTWVIVDLRGRSTHS